MPANCIAWSNTERQHVMVCPDDLCRNGSPLCGLERGIDFEEGDMGYDDYWDGEDDIECLGPEGDCGMKGNEGHVPPCPLSDSSGG